ncbi:MAG: class I SAM-dependent methyltransferase [Candidatus Methanoperedens sp.]|nr:class I SAM-dependent methyltransferase [Candidatus Methanoperedens sp.]
MIDEKKINQNIDKLHIYFNKILEKYFVNGKPISKYFEETSCYNCGSSEISNSFPVNRFTHVRCKNCQMVYVNPRFKESFAHDLYNEKDYTEFYKIKLIPSIDYRRNVLAVNKYNQIMRFFDKPGNVMDIGSGLGEVLSVFKERGWDSLGIEFNEFAANYSRTEFGLKIVNKSIFDFDSSEKYDLIMLWGVLEHFFEPRKVLEKAYELLNDDGLLVLEVPSADSVLVRYYERTLKSVDRIIEGDRHLMLFSLRSFKEITEKAGFSPVEIISNGLDISTLNRLELGNTINLSHINELQKLLDDSMQGDLMRGFFKKKVSE